LIDFFLKDFFLIDFFLLLVFLDFFFLFPSAIRCLFKGGSFDIISFDIISLILESLIGKTKEDAQKLCDENRFKMRVIRDDFIDKIGNLALKFDYSTDAYRILSRDETIIKLIKAFAK
jgi:hypothetical protein